jgi:hypothetical protein
MRRIRHHNAPFSKSTLDQPKLAEIHLGDALLQVSQAPVDQFG